MTSDRGASLNASAQKALRRFKSWFVNDAAPLWAEKGFDRKNSRFHEVLDKNGRPIPGADHRVRVQARQIYTFCELARLKWLAGADEIAAAGFEGFLRRAFPDGDAEGCVHLMSEDGVVLDARRDLYDQAFVLLMCAARWREARDERAIDLADKTISYIDRALRSPFGGWRESSLSETPRRQNPHMHLLEAFLALFAARADKRYFNYASSIYTLFLEKFYDEATSVVREYFDDELAPAPSPTGDVVEPGHMMEWTSLLDLYSRHGGANTDSLIEKLFLQAQSMGRDENGFLSDSVMMGNKRRSATRRLWPQLEFLRAMIVCSRRLSWDQNGAMVALTDSLFRGYLNHSTSGLWIDVYENGRANADTTPASVLYHLLECAAAANSAIGDE